MYVCIDGVIISYLFSHRAQHIVGSEEIITIDNPHHITCSHTYALVHGIIKSTVLLRYPFHPSLKTRLILTQYLHRVIRRSTVHHDILHIVMVLPQHRLYGVTNRQRTIICYCNE